jgi:hypothetical protein
MLLFIISIFYIPAALDPFRYRATAIMHIIPSRGLRLLLFPLLGSSARTGEGLSFHRPGRSLLWGSIGHLSVPGFQGWSGTGHDVPQRLVSQNT